VSLSKQILVALVAGIAIGLFFGEKVGFLEIGGRAFVQDLHRLTPLAYVLPRGEPELRRVVDTWIDVARGYERFASARGYWILGQAARQQKPRWSVARDVLDWWKG
jgi:hypothetical protein